MIKRVVLEEDQFNTYMNAPYIMIDGRKFLNYPQSVFNKQAIEQLAKTAGFDVKLFHNGKEIV